MRRCKKSIVLTLALALLVTVLTVSGSTVAWFTEKTESANNILAGGTLDIEMQYRSVDADGNAMWNHVEKNTPVFEDNGSHLPGHLEVVLVRAQNAGTLDLKYQLVVTAENTQTGTSVTGQTIRMTDLLQVGACVIDESKIGNYINEDGSVNRSSVLEMITPGADNTADIKMYSLKDYSDSARTGVVIELEKNVEKQADGRVVKAKAADEAEFTTDQPIALILYMPGNIGNEANFRGEEPKIAIGVSMIAGQAASETDSFDDEYDLAANYPAHFDIEAYLNSLNSQNP